MNFEYTEAILAHQRRISGTSSVLCGNATLLGGAVVCLSVAARVCLWPMTHPETDICPGCGVALTPINGPTHRYIGASPSCWAVFSALVNGGEPPLASSPLNTLILDAYAVQHPGVSSPQAIQSVAVHLLALHGVLKAGVSPANALWVRQQAIGKTGSSRRNSYVWLSPPSFVGALTVVDIVQEATPSARAQMADRYVRDVWQRWQAMYGSIVAGWYETFILA